MPTITLTNFLADLRTFSGLGSNDFLEDSDLTGFVEDALRELDDQMVVVNRHWRSKTYEFTLTDTNYIDLAASVPDYQATQGVDDLANPAKPRNVDRLGSFAERNVVTGKRYFEDGERLTIYGRNVKGRYALKYTPQSITLASKQTASWDIGDSAAMTGHNRTLHLAAGDRIDGAAATIYVEAGDFGADDVGAQINIATNVQTLARLVTEVVDPSTVVVNAPLADDDLGDPGADLSIADVSNLAFPEAEFTADMIGGSVTITFDDGLNEGDNGTFTVYDVLSPTLVQIRLLSFSSLTNPTSGTVSTEWQPAGTVDVLPPAVHQWLLFIKLHAAIAIREAQELETADFERKFAIQRQRINAMAHKRSDGPIQPPVRNPRRRFGSLGRSY